MKLHQTVVTELIRIYKNYGGFREETRLLTELEKLELSQYTQKTGEKDTFLVLTEDIIKHQR